MSYLDLMSPVATGEGKISQEVVTRTDLHWDSPEYNLFLDRITVHKAKGRTFEEVWKATGYNYGEDELESVKLGWELAMKEMGNV